MPPSRQPEEREPSRDEIDALAGPVLLEFGASWCGYCQELAPHLAKMLDEFPTVRHIKIEDGKGKPLGRSFRVKLWPNLVFMRDGQVIEQMARPDPFALRPALEAITVGKQ